MSLEYTEHLPTQQPTSLVILLHGYGADKNDLIGLAPHLAHALPETAFVSPDAISPCETGFGRQWFSLQSMDTDSIYDGLQIAHPHIDNFIDEQMQRFNLSADKVALVGFSQGTMLSLHTAPRRTEQLACVVGFSGMLAGSDKLANEIKTTPTINLIHGAVDTVVDADFMELASDCLKQNGCTVDTLLCADLAHGIDNDGLLNATLFLQKHLYPQTAH